MHTKPSHHRQPSNRPCGHRPEDARRLGLQLLETFRRFSPDTAVVMFLGMEVSRSPWMLFARGRQLRPG